MNKPIGDLKPEAEVSTAPHVLQAINAVMSDVAREGIGKDRKNEQQGYKFRGIDDVYNALAPILARNRLVITPRCLTRTKEMVPTKSGGSMFYVTVDMEFELASAVDGSTKTAQMFGEAMDTGDKATNKAMSAAYKYMAMQEFCIPTEGDNDADATTHQLAGQQSKPEEPADPEQHALFVAATAAIDICADEPGLNRWKAETTKAGGFDRMPDAVYEAVGKYWAAAVMRSRANTAHRAPTEQQRQPAQQDRRPREDFVLDDEIPF